MKEGELFRVETIEWTGGQIKNSDSADDVKNLDLTQVRLHLSHGLQLISPALSRF